MDTRKTTTKKDKPLYKVGDEVYNSDEGQRSVILSLIGYDKEYEEYCYGVKCLEDEGSLHSVGESDLEKLTVVKVTLEEIKNYYIENCLDGTNTLEIVKSK